VERGITKLEATERASVLGPGGPVSESGGTGTRRNSAAEPDVDRIAVCCDLAETMYTATSEFSAFKGLTASIFPNLFQAVFLEYDPAGNDGQRFDFAQGEPRFKACQTLEAEKARTVMDIRLWETQVKTKSKQAANRTFMLNHVSNNTDKMVLSRVVQAWRLVTSDNKAKREKLKTAFSYFFNRRQKQVVHEWKVATDKLKHARLSQEVEQLNHQTTSVEDIYKELEEETLHYQAAVAALKVQVSKDQREEDVVLGALNKVRAKMAVSEEAQLQEIAAEWRQVQVSLVSNTLSRCKAVLTSMADEERPDLNLFVRHGEEMSSILGLDIDELILRWVGAHLRHTGYSKNVQNFTTDLSNSEAYSALLHSLTASCPHGQLPFALSKYDLVSRSEEICDRLSQLHPPSPQIVKPSDITEGAADLNLAQLCFLFAEKPGLNNIEPPKAWKIAEQALHRVEQQWTALFAGHETKHGTSIVHAASGAKYASPLRATEAQEAESGVKSVSTAATTGPTQERAGNFDPQQLEVAARNLADAEQKVAVAVRERWANMSMWQSVQHAVRKAGLDILLRHGRRQPVVVPDRKKELEQVKFTHIQLERVSSVLAAGKADPSSEIHKVQQVLETKFEDIRKVFMSYSAEKEGEGGSSLSLSQFTHIARDSKLVPSKLSMKALVKVFTIANNEATDDKTTFNPDNELTGEEFAEALLRLSVEVNTKEDSRRTASQLLTELLEQHILKYSRRSTNIEQWRRLCGGKEVKAILSRHQDKLQLLYKEYAKNSDTAALSFADLVALTTDRNVIDETFTTTDLQRVFMKIQGEDGSGVEPMLPTSPRRRSAISQAFASQDKNTQDKFELSFAEYLEALIAICIFRDPCPYQPLPVKLGKFLYKHFAEGTQKGKDLRKTRRKSVTTVTQSSSAFRERKSTLKKIDLAGK
jgi:hypothetical protein